MCSFSYFAAHLKRNEIVRKSYYKVRSKKDRKTVDFKYHRWYIN
ncbi:hypothetical protein J2Y02_003773 [Neobacillus drentensis]|nr:hypothetical protein [Neobacillus drentensis]